MDNTTYTINFEKFLDRVNGYRFDFMENTITGKLTAYNNGFLTVELRSGNVICEIDLERPPEAGGLRCS